MGLEIVNEGTTAYLTVEFTDKNGAAAAPSSISYRIDCETNDEQVRDDTPVTPGTSVEITLTSGDNEIIDGSHSLEKRVVTITAIYGEDDEVSDEYKYQVKNLKHKPSPA
jgi:hypothetical protein